MIILASFPNNSKCTVVKIYVLIDDSNSGLKKMNSDGFARQNLWIPVEKAEASIRVNKE